MRKITPNLLNPKYKELIENFKGGKIPVSKTVKVGGQIFKIPKISNV
jgi:hypothetical protein